MTLPGFTAMEIATDETRIFACVAGIVGHASALLEA
jgi:hypothetical protein